MASIKERESSLAERFIASFDKLDEMRAFKVTDLIAWGLAVGEEDEYGRKPWRPIHVSTDRSLLEPLYSKIPSRFPPLYERLVLSYRWAEVDLQIFTLLANPPGPDLSGLLTEMSKAKDLWSSQLKAGYVQFGRAAGGHFDPVSFEIKSRKKDGDCRIVRIDHEQILCYGCIKVVAELAPSFEQLVSETINRANKIA